ncbi:MAG: hypothetical protein ACP5G0_13655 [Desulfomonilia bacterium]
MRKLLVFLLAVGLVFVFTAPISAAEQTVEERIKALEETIGCWTFYGSARMTTFYEDSNLDADTDDAGTTWALQGNGRIGARVTKDKISGRFEYGTGVNLRLLYGTYNFGTGTILFGQDYTPLGSMFYSNQVYLGDNDLLGWGQIYGGRVPQVKIMMKGLEIAFVENKASSKLNATTGDVDVLLPKLEARYHLAQDMFFADVFGGFSTFKIEDVVVSSIDVGDETVNAWAVGVGGGVKLDVAYINAQVYMAQNAKNFGLAHTDADGAFFDAAGDLVDEDNLGFSLIAGAKLDKYTVEAGFGYVSSELDVSDAETDTAMSYYLNVTVPVYGGFFFVPEVGVLDYGDGDDGEDEDKDTTYFGAKWQINF